MKYLCLAYYDVVKFQELPPEQLQELEAQCPKFDEMLRATGHLVLQGSLADPGAGASMRPWKGKPVMTDGPFIETKEQIGGMFIIEAKSLAQALQVASNHPAARIGEAAGWGLEIRPIEALEDYSVKSAT